MEHFLRKVNFQNWLKNQKIKRPVVVDKIEMLGKEL